MVFYNSEVEHITNEIIVYEYDSELEYGIEATESDYVEPDLQKEDYKKSYEYINQQFQQIIFPYSY